MHLIRRHPRLLALLLLICLIAAGLVLAAPSLRTWYHLRAARSETARFHNAQAIRHLQVCLDRWPNDPDVLFLAARAARRARNYAESERLLEKYQQLRGLDNESSSEQLLLTVERNVDRMAAQCWRSVEADPESSRSSLLFEALTRGYLRKYELTNARACLNHWLVSQPNCVQAHYLDGLFILDYLHAKNEAERSYRRALDLDPEHEEARLGLAFILVDTKTFSEAIDHLEYLKKRQPENLRLQMGLAECYAGSGDLTQAEQLADGVLAQEPRYAAAIALQGRLALQNGEYEQAETLLRCAVELAPSDRRARHNLINCLNRSGKTEEAQRHQKDIEERDKDLARFDEIVTKELPERPTDPSLHCTLGQLFLREGFAEEGLRWLQSALQIDPQYAPARQALKDYYATLAKEKR